MNSIQTKIYIPADETRRVLLEAFDLSWEKIAEYYRPSAGVADWMPLVGEGNWGECKSAKMLATSWEEANPDLPREVAALFEDSPKLLIATPEHKTRLKGRGAPSQSDVLAFVRVRGKTYVVVVEGKKEECFKKTVSDWLAKAPSNSKNRKKRLRFIYCKLGLLCPLPDSVKNIHYQLLHRTAAAVIEAQRFNADCAAMIVQSFSKKHTGFTDFTAFLNLFGIDSVERDKIYKTAKPGITLYLGWASP